MAPAEERLLSTAGDTTRPRGQRLAALGALCRGGAPSDQARAILERLVDSEQDALVKRRADWALTRTAPQSHGG